MCPPISTWKGDRNVTIDLKMARLLSCASWASCFLQHQCRMNLNSWMPVFEAAQCEGNVRNAFSCWNTSVLFGDACTLLQECCQMAFYSYLRVLCRGKKWISLPFFFWPKSACRSLYSLTRLGSRPVGANIVCAQSGFPKCVWQGWRWKWCFPRTKWQDDSLTLTPGPQEGTTFS